MLEQNREIVKVKSWTTGLDLQKMEKKKSDCASAKDFAPSNRNIDESTCSVLNAISSQVPAQLLAYSSLSQQDGAKNCKSRSWKHVGQDKV